MTNPLDALFQKFSNLLPLHISIPEPTAADISYVQALNWEPETNTGKDLKDALVNLLQTKGSSFSEKDLQTWMYGNADKYKEIAQNPNDKARVTAITGAWPW